MALLLRKVRVAAEKEARARPCHTHLRHWASPEKLLRFPRGGVAKTEKIAGQMNVGRGL